MRRLRQLLALGLLAAALVPVTACSASIAGTFSIGKRTPSGVTVSEPSPTPAPSASPSPEVR